MRKLTATKQTKALNIIAEWMGPLMTEDGSPAPTGQEAASRGLGPMLVGDWDWPSEPTPTVLLEGGLGDWAVRAAGDPGVVAKMSKLGIFVEPYAGWALCLYPA